MKRHSAYFSMLFSIGVTWAGVALAEPNVIGGITPDRRPEGLPTVGQTGLTQAGQERILHGVSRPYPPSLRWIEDQGGWFTPFANPGMTGPYDIRNWHQKGKG